MSSLMEIMIGFRNLRKNGKKIGGRRIFINSLINSLCSRQYFGS